jgi:hypothetical protein
MSPPACLGWRTPYSRTIGAPHRVAEDDRTGDADRITEGSDVVRASFEAPCGCVAPVRPPVPAQIDVDNLGMLPQPGEVRFEVGVVVDPGPAVHQHHGRPQPHLVALGHEYRPIHVEPQSRPIDVDVHRVDSSGELKASRDHRRWIETRDRPRASSVAYNDNR